MAYNSNNYNNNGNFVKDRNAPKGYACDTFQNAVGEALVSLDNLESPSLRLTKLMHYSSGSDNSVEMAAICKCTNKLHGNCDGVVAAIKRLPGNVCFRMALAARMMVNQSGSVLNLGILLHRNYSCPYILGSALKGITRHYAVEQYGAEDAAVLRIFGGHFEGQDNAGSVAFMNAFPTSGSNWKLVSDVLTRHNDPADNGPMDTKNPVPIVFPAVEKGAQFDFIVAPARACVASSDVEIAAKWLREALQENGVGAKTSAGYGWFREM